jgi:hypothetical protein
MELNYACTEECGNTVTLDQDYLTYLNWNEGDALPEPQCAKCLAILTHVG